MSDRIEVEVEGGTEPAEAPVERRGSGGILSMLFVLPGLGFIAFGVAIIIWEDLLRYVVAVVFILVGLGLLYAARKIGQVKQKIRRKKEEFTSRFGGSR